MTWQRLHLPVLLALMPRGKEILPRDPDSSRILTPLCIHSSHLEVQYNVRIFQLYWVGPLWNPWPEKDLKCPHLLIKGKSEPKPRLDLSGWQCNQEHCPVGEAGHSSWPSHPGLVGEFEELKQSVRVWNKEPVPREPQAGSGDHDGSIRVSSSLSNKVDYYEY